MSSSHKEPYGYLVADGYRGWVEELGSFMMFPTEQEYMDYIFTEVENETF